MIRSFRIALRITTTLIALLLILSLAAVLILKSDWFLEKVRQRVVTELERAIGGTATLGNFTVNWRLLSLEFRDLTLHGTEPPSVPPLLEAKSIQVGLKVVSFWKRDVDLQSIVVREPRVNVVVGPDGSTNIPEPKIKRISNKAGFEPILDWKIARFALENGALLFAEQKSALNVKGENLKAQFSYDFTGPRYKGQLSIQPLEVNTRDIAQPIDVYLVLGLEKNRIDVSRARLDMRQSYVDASGAIANLSSPTGTFQFTGHFAVRQAGQWLKIRAARSGTVDVAGSGNYNSTSDYSISATASARGLEVQEDEIHVAGAHATMLARLNPRGLQLDDVIVDLLGGRFTGRADFPKIQRVIVDGSVQDIPIRRGLETVVPELSTPEKTSWSGLVSGPIHVDARLRGRDAVLTANIAITPASGGIPVEGSADIKYDAASRTLSFGKSHIVTPGAQMDVSGVLGEQLQANVVSTNLQDLLPAINVFAKAPLDSLPVQLKNGKATFDGTVTGKLTSPQIAGAVSLSNFVYSGIDFTGFAGQVKLDEASLQVQNGDLKRGAAEARMSVTVGLNDWNPEPPNNINANVSLAGAELSELLNLAGQKQIAARGLLAASAHVSGTIGSPRGSADITIAKGAFEDEPFDRLQASVEYSPNAINVRQSKVTAGPAQLTASATFEPAKPFSGAPEFKHGRARFQVSSNDMTLQRFQFMKRLRPDLSGALRLKFDGSADVHEGAANQPPQALLTALNGEAAANGLRLGTRSIGNMKATASTQASTLHFKLDSDFLNSNLQAAGQWRLVPGYPGEANASFSQISLVTVRNWLTTPGERSKLNFDGSAEGAISIAGPALEPAAWKASAKLSKLEMYPAESGEQRGIATRFTLRNEGPVVVTLEKSVMTLATARFSGTSSDITLAGTLRLEPKAALDLRVNGGVNLAILQNFDQDIETGGAVTINASIHGSPDQPLINGQVDVQRGSLHFVDITTGVSAANGTITFTGSQATIQKLSGQVGGGAFDLTGVIGYAGGELSYRVDAKAKDVRVRYPEGVSTSANAELSLRGTTQRSMLSGTLTVLRTGFTPRTDFSSILGKASEPVRTPSAHTGPLSGMQFDIRVETAPDISFESSLAQDLQVEGNLRLQGTPYNPVLLGRINVSQGEINFFGTQYSINQGSVTFTNPVKLEPVIDVDLETRVQGIDVTLTIAGPITKLTITPRSDPPMQYSDVLALLATGSRPSSDPTLAGRQNAPQNFAQIGPTALIGQVVANPVSSRLQRFFGVSKLKIDPQFTGVENNPQARITLEQQVTKNVTFTYITNIATANQLIVRIEWALNKNWSAIAVRDENGLFGLDFLYKKRFK